MEISNRITGFVNHIKDLPKPRPTTSADTVAASPEGAALSGGITGYFSSGTTPEGAVGGALGGYVGIKVGEKTESLGKAVGASFITGATANALAATGIVAAKNAITGAAIGINPLGLAIFSAIGGLSGISGMMQGSCMGDVKDSGTTGMLMGATMSAMGGSPLLTVSSSLAGSVGGMIKNKPLKILAAGATGAALGGACGALAGPAGMVINGIMGAVAGIGASIGGPVIGQIQRNLQEDLQKGIVGKLKGLVKGLGTKGRIALGALGGAISALPMALMGGVIAGPIGFAVPLVAMGALTGAKVNKILKHQEKIQEYSSLTMNYLKQDFPQEQIDQTPPQILNGLTMYFNDKYPKKEDFANLTQEEFRRGMNDYFELLSAEQVQEQPAGPEQHAPPQTAG